MARLPLLLCASLVTGCDGPPDDLEIEPLTMSTARNDLPRLAAACGNRGRLFAVGRDQSGAGVLLEEADTGLIVAELELAFESPLPPLRSCVQLDNGVVLAVGGSVVLSRSPSGEYARFEVEAAPEGTDLQLTAIAEDDEQVFLFGSLDGVGVALRGDVDSWTPVDIDGPTLGPFVAAIRAGEAVIAVGEFGAAIRIDGARVTRLQAPPAPLSAVAHDGSEVVVASADGTIWFVEGRGLVPFTRLNLRAHTAAFATDGSLWLGGEGGGVVRYPRLPSGALSAALRQVRTPSAADVIALFATPTGMRALAAGDAEVGELWTAEVAQ